MSTVLEGLPIVSGIQPGPYRVAGNPPVIYNVDTTLLWGGGRTNMYWKGPAPSNIPAPVVSVKTSDVIEMFLDITGIQGQTPYHYYLVVGQDPAGPFLNAGADQTQRHQGSGIMWTVTGLTIGTTYYFAVVVGNGFDVTGGEVSVPIVA
jgi:hypothetical protein